MQDEPQHDEMRSKDRGALGGEALLQSRLQIQALEEQLNNNGSRKGGQLLVFEAKTRELVETGQNGALAAFHLRCPPEKGSMNCLGRHHQYPIFRGTASAYAAVPRRQKAPFLCNQRGTPSRPTASTSDRPADNVVIPGKIGGSSVWIDNQAPPEERYKNQSKVYNPDVAMQFHMHGSPDGIHWRFLRRLQLPHRGGWDSQSIIFRDPAIRALRPLHPPLGRQAPHHRRGQRELPDRQAAGVRRSHRLGQPADGHVAGRGRPGDVRDKPRAGSRGARETLRQDADGLLRRNRVQVPRTRTACTSCSPTPTGTGSTASRW